MEDEDYTLPAEEIKRERFVKRKDGKKKKIKKERTVQIEAIGRLWESRGLANSLERIAILDTVPGNTEIEGFWMEYEQEFFRHPHYETLVWKWKEDGERYYKDHKRVLWTMYKIVSKFGGYKEVVSRHEWKSIAEKIGYKTEEEARNDYVRFFFFYERLTNSESLFTMSYSKDKVKLEDANPYWLKEVPYMNVTTFKTVEKDVAENILSNSAFIIRNFLHAADINPSIFKIDAILPIMKNDEIDVWLQKMTTGVVTEWKLSKGTLTFKEYLTDLSWSFNLEVNENTQLKWGINFDISPYLKLDEELVNKVPEEFRFGSPKDILRNSRQHVKGTTLPQMFFHPPHTWIGGHQQPVGLRSAIINHGPGDLEWTIISPDSIPVVEKIFSDVYEIEMFRNEGLWYVNTDLLIANNVPWYTVTQREGDLLLLGPGVVSMRKATSFWYQTSWNFATKDLSQLTEGFNRIKMDAKWGLTVSSYLLIIIGTSSVLYANPRYSESRNRYFWNSRVRVSLLYSKFYRLIYKEFKARMIEDSSILDEFLQLFYIKEKDICIEDMRRLFKHEPDNWNILFWTRCSQEVFNYWVVVPLNVDEGPHYFWISCANKRVDFLRNNQKESKFLFKYSEKHLNSLLSRILRKIRDPKSRFENKIEELSSKFKIELFEPLEKEKEKDTPFRRTKFVREISLKELKAKEIKPILSKKEESKIENEPSVKNEWGGNVENNEEKAPKQSEWGVSFAGEVSKPTASECEEVKPSGSAEESKKDLTAISRTKEKDLRTSLMSIVKEGLTVESIHNSPTKKIIDESADESKADEKKVFGTQKTNKYKKLEVLLKSLIEKRHFVIDNTVISKLMSASNDSYSLSDAKELEGVLPIMNKILKSNSVLEKYKALIKKLQLKLKKLLSLDNIQSPKKDTEDTDKQGNDKEDKNEE